MKKRLLVVAIAGAIATIASAKIVPAGPQKGAIVSQTDNSQTRNSGAKQHTNRAKHEKGQKGSHGVNRQG